MSPRKKAGDEEAVQVTLEEIVMSSEKRSRRRATREVAETTPVETDLEGIKTVGKKVLEKLVDAGYGTVDKLARSKASILAEKVKGLSKERAQKLIDEAKALRKARQRASKKPEGPSKKTTTKTKGEKSITESETTVTPLTAIRGIGPKLATKLIEGGYDSVERLARSKPQTVAGIVDGLGITKARQIVSAAREYVKQKQIESLVGPKESTTTSKREAKPSKKKTTPKKTTKKTEKAKEKKPKVTPRRKAKPHVAPHKRPVRKQSGLPVPAAVTKLAEELRRQWREAEKRAASKTGDETQATVEVVALTREETMERLVDEAMEILNETMTTGRPAFEIPSRSSDNIVWDEVRDLLLLGMKTISRPYHSLASVVDATRTARVMEIVFQLLRSNLHATKREIYYSDVNLFRDQKYSDKIIEDVASMLQTTRDSIHVVASARGSAMGRVIIRDGGDLIDLTKMGTGGWAITPFLDQVEIVESDAEFIILSEKDAAVMRLAESKYWNRQPCIVLTGKGSGDMATRAFLKRLVKELEIPAFALVDSDPYGHYIYSVFLRGSKRLSYESPFIATPELKLLGVLSRDLDAYNIPRSVRIPMEPADIKRVKDMLKEPFVRKNREWVEDLQLMLKIKEKAEIQAFASHSFQFLTDEYLPTKLETGDWI